MSSASVGKGVFAERAPAALAAHVGTEAEQLDLLPVIARSVSPHDQAGLAQLVADEQERRKAGRPKGATNVSSRQLKAMIEQVLGGNPLLWRARWLALEPEEMALRLGITKDEAWNRQDKIAAEFARYFLAPLAPTDEKGNAVPSIAVLIGGEGINTSVGGLPPWHRAFKTVDGEAVEYQGLSDGEGQKSHGQKSDEAE